MNVSDAVLSRSSIRAFTDIKVPNSIIEEILIKSSRSPSGGNLQPWKIYVINNGTMDKFLEFQKQWIEPETSAYDIYPKKLKEPYRTSRFELGEEMYALLGIDRDDKNARISQVMKNFEFFGAPCSFFCFVDRQMGPPQWSDLGMFLQTFMLLAKEAGIDTCAQEAWSMKQESVSQFVNAGDEDILFCGMSIGYKDPKAIINSLVSERRPIDTWATFI